MPKNFHACIKLDKLLELTLRGQYNGWLENDGAPLTELQIYQLVEQEKAKGKIYFCGCDNQDSEGKCLGHEVPTNKG